jgi:protein-S-isoprenylcysteine O-methyltransferase Ste14
MAAHNRAVVLVMIGVALASFSVLADTIGVGAHPDFGWKQIVGTVAGVVIVGIGVWGMRARRE